MFHSNFSDHYLRGSASRGYFQWPPNDQWARVIAARRERPGSLAGQSEALGALEQFNREAGNDSDAVRKNLVRLSQTQTMAVVTGQQAGLLLSPLYVIHKAAAALKLAARIERNQGVPVVPVFWIASDDHDLDEVAAVRWIGKDGALEQFTLDTSGHPPGTPVYAVRVGRDASRSLLDQMRDTTHDTEFKAAWLNWLEREFEREPTLEESFARLIARLFGGHGLALLAPRLPALRRLFAPVLRRDIERPGALTTSVMEAAVKLESDGFTATLHRREGDCNFFVESSGVRRKVRAESGQFQSLDVGSNEVTETHQAAAMMAMLENEPERFSPNVVTRPLAQDAVFSTLAYVAGPGEIAYHAQLRGVYEECGVFQPVVWPRPRVALIEPRLRRSAEKLGLALETYPERTQEEWRDLILAQSESRAAIEQFEQRRRRIEDELNGLDAELGKISKDVSDALRKTRETIDFALDKLAERVKGGLTQSEMLMRHLDKIELALRPLGQPQERVLSPVCPMLFNFDVQWLEKLVDQMDVGNFETQFISL